MNLFRHLLLLLLLVAASPAAANTVGDISGDGKIDLTEAVYALRVSAGVYPGLDPSCILTGRNQWAAGAAYRECDVVSHANATFVCLQPHTSTTGANEPPLATHWLRLDLKGDKGEVGPGCWDLNGDQNCDHGREDTNMDGVCDARDCPPWLDVRAFGAVGDGATDSTDAIQAAIDHAASIPTFQRPVVLLPHGNFVVTRTIHVTTASTQIRGSGMRNSHLIFAPPAADSGNAGLHLAPAPVASYLENVQLSDFTVIGGNGNAKTLIKIEGLNESRIERIQLNSHDAGDLGTIGLHVTGWDTTQISDLAIHCARPILISPDTVGQTTPGPDHFVFRNLMLSSESKTHPIIEVASGTNLSNVTFDGYQAWVGGNGGFLWDSSTTPGGNAINLSFQNVRWETGGLTGIASPRPTVTMLPHTQAANVSFVNCYFGLVEGEQPGPGTVFLGRRLHQLSFINTRFARPNLDSDVNVAYDLDESCDQVSLVNCTSDQGVGITRTGALLELYATGAAEVWPPEIGSSRLLVDPTNRSTVGRTFSIGGVGHFSRSVTLAPGTSANVPKYGGAVTTISLGFNEGTGAGGGCALVITPQTPDNTALKLYGTANCVGALPKTNEVGVYRNDGDGTYKVENRLGEARNFLIQTTFSD